MHGLIALSWPDGTHPQRNLFQKFELGTRFVIVNIVYHSPMSCTSRSEVCVLPQNIRGPSNNSKHHLCIHHPTPSLLSMPSCHHCLPSIFHSISYFSPRCSCNPSRILRQPHTKSRAMEQYAVKVSGLSSPRTVSTL